MGKRIFIGIKAGKKLQNYIRKWRKTHLKEVNVRWIPDRNLHITLIPPWNEDKVDQVIEKLKNLNLQFSSFEIQFSKLEFGPNYKKPRLIWARGVKPKEFYWFEKLLSKPLGKRLVRRSPFVHTTLARFQQKDFVKFSLKKLNEKVFWKEKVNCFCLFESRLLKTGAEYEILHELVF